MPQDTKTWIEPFDPDNKCRGPLIGHSKMNSGKTPEELLIKAKKKWDKKEREQRERTGL